MERKIAVPALEPSLDHLPSAKSMALANREIEPLFGFNDVALARIRRFASRHNCIVSHANSCVVFQKISTP
ncbi:MAG TPA: hypothetical protein VJ846_04895 [Sphingomicrobium sp.]|nr:hypothetical protein [Sphingomicrobium sp.]